jgi:hypothetical protein
VETAIVAEPGFAIFVEMAVKLPFTLAEFTAAKQTAFRRGVATAADVKLASVVITGVREVDGRRAAGRTLLAAAVEVDLQIGAATRALADSLTGRLTADALNTALAAQGLPAATITKSAKAVVAGTDPLPGAGGGVVDDLVDAFKTNVAVIAAAGAAGGVVFLCCLGALFYFCVFRRRDSPTQKRAVCPDHSE